MNSKEPFNFIQFATPVGSILLCASTEGVCRLDFLGHEPYSKDALIQFVQSLFPHCEIDLNAHLLLLQSVKTAILRYFHERIPLPPFPLDMRIGSTFQQLVWRALCEIPFGDTRSYLQVAKRIGKPNAARAVGQACGRNPVAILIPCHRVLANDGTLGGFSSGLLIKKVLLQIELMDPLNTSPQ